MLKKCACSPSQTDGMHAEVRAEQTMMVVPVLHFLLLIIML